MITVIKRILTPILFLYILFVGYIYYRMTRRPLEFAAMMANMPGPVYMMFPFETMWLRARAGTLAMGTQAPDFDLPTVDHYARVKLSSFQGSKPVVLVFGSYT